ncbi:MAG: hypothetical protein QOF83_4318 [Solirubrobacteraceae bacterium]|jgi:hypothetical protein|nr:hypothetical protein [Solirubrobacteraceae bacterium]
MPDESPQASIVTDPPITRLETVARLAMGIPKPWVIAVAIAAVLSAFHITVTTGGTVSGSFAPSTLTGVLIALVWLPAIVRVIAIAGGGVKTPAGEASTSGLLTVLDSLEPETKRDTLPSIIAALTSAEILVDPDRRLVARPFQQDLEMQLAAASVPAKGVREQLAAYAKQYEEARHAPSSRERTLRMTSVMAEARAAARATPLPLIDLRNMLSSDSDGERVIALALAQDQPDVRLFDLTLPAISDSHSAFEQYQALGAMLEIVPQLNHRQRSQLSQALDHALQDESRDIHTDTSRFRLVQAIRDMLNSA